MLKKNLLVVTGTLLITNSFAVGPEDAIAAASLANEPLMVATVALGNTIYVNCIQSPPITPEQQAICASEYGTYIANSQILHIDMTGGKNTPLGYPVSDPYSWSPYDVCRIDMGNLLLTPICGSGTPST